MLNLGTPISSVPNLKFAKHYRKLLSLSKVLPSRQNLRPKEMGKRIQPFFIVSAGRSGSTLLASLLDKHSMISMPTEQFVLAQSIVKYNLFKWMQWEDLTAIICTEYIRSKGNQSWNLDARALIDEVHAFPKRKRNLWDLLDHIYRKYGIDRGAPKKLWGDKTPSNHEHIDIIHSVFSEAKYLFLIRDGRDVVNSYLKKEDEPDDPQFGVDEWLRSIEMMDALQPKLADNQHITIRYRDLVHQPEVVFKEIFQLLEVPFEPVYTSSNEGYLKKMGDIGNRDFMTKVAKPINASSIGSWKEELEPEVLEFIEPQMKKQLKRFSFYK